MQRRALAALTAAVGMSLAGGAQATLFDRGGGLIYDDVLNVTWLQDANYAKTSGYDSDGLMTWYDAKTWAANLVYGGYDDWRLPSMTATPICDFSQNNYGGTDCGYNVRTTGAGQVYSELASLYHDTLGNLSRTYSSGGQRPVWGLVNTDADGVDFLNLNAFSPLGYYSIWWIDRVWPTGVGGFQPGDGSQSVYAPTSPPSYAWAVRDGDVRRDNAVPEPESLLLVGLAVAGVIAARRRV